MDNYREAASGLFVPASSVAGSHVDIAERIAELELAQDDYGWLRMAGDGDTFEFTRGFVTTITRLARLMYLKNPLIQRGVKVKADYVFGRGVNINAKDDDVDDVIQAFLSDETNQTTFTSHSARIQREIELQTDGNIFFVLVPHPLSGHIRIRSFAADEITDIITDPDDRARVWYYKREFYRNEFDFATAQTKRTKITEYYRDWRYKTRDRATIGGKPIINGAYIYHIKVGGFTDWKYGISEIYSVIDWATAYKRFLENWSTIVAAYARFAFKARTARGKAGVQSIQKKLATTVKPSAATGETNPPPATASTAVMTSDDDLEPIRTAGATTSAEDGRRLLLMVAAGVGVPETFFGDVSVGSLATAQSLDRPTELLIGNRQALWVDIWHDILTFVIEYAIRAPEGALRAFGDVKINEYGEEYVEFDDDNQRHIDIDFPAIVQIDPATYVTTTLAAREVIPDNRTVARMVLTALGENDIDHLLDTLWPVDSNGDPIDDESGDEDVDALGVELQMLGQTIESLREAITSLRTIPATLTVKGANNGV